MTTERGWRHWIRTGLPFAVVLLVALLALRCVKPAVPKQVLLLTGPEGSTYYEDGQRYAAFLTAHGIGTEVVPTEGSLDNLILLAAEDRPAVGFAEAGIESELTDEGIAQELVSLGSLYVEPFWLFVRVDRPVSSLADLRGRRLAPGLPGSSARTLADALLQANGLERSIIAEPFENWSAEMAATALVAGELDAVMLVGEPGSPVLDSLLSSDVVQPFSFRRADAYIHRFPQLAQVILPEGAFDLARNIPPEDLHLLAGATNLVARDGLHPALSDLLLDAARQVHREATIFAPRGAFPSPDHTSLPLSRAAEHYYEEGPSVLRQVLPFWLATLVDRFLVLALAVLTAAVTVFKILPRLISLPFALALKGMYRRLEQIEKSGKGTGDREAQVAALDELERQSAKMWVPRAEEAAFFELRQNIHDVRERVAGRK